MSYHLRFDARWASRYGMWGNLRVWLKVGEQRSRAIHMSDRSIQISEKRGSKQPLRFIGNPIECDPFPCLDIVPAGTFENSPMLQLKHWAFIVCPAGTERGDPQALRHFRNIGVSCPDRIPGAPTAHDWPQHGMIGGPCSPEWLRCI